MALTNITFRPLLPYVLIACSFSVCARPWDHGVLQVSSSPVEGRYLELVNQSGDRTPFFWMADTAWGIIRNSFQDAMPNKGQPVSLDDYFRTRAAQGFNVVQTQLLPFTVYREQITNENDANKNAYGFMAFTGGNSDDNADFTQPIIQPGDGINDYWDYVEIVLNTAEENGIYLAIVPTWNFHLPVNNYPDVVTDTSVAYDFGNFLGSRFGSRPNIIWMMGGDAFITNTQFQAFDDSSSPEFPFQLLAMNISMAEGIADGTNGVYQHNGKADYDSTLMTLHPRGGLSSKDRPEYRQAAFMDFDSIQTSATQDRLSTAGSATTYINITRTITNSPYRPALESEVSYEHSFRSFIDPSSSNFSEVDGIPITSWEARRSGYLAVFSGSLGYTYGNFNIIQFLRSGQSAHNGFANAPWFESMGVDLISPGCPAEFATCQTLKGTSAGEAANHMRHLRNLIESRYISEDNGKLIQSRVPDQSIIAKKYQNRNRFTHRRAMRADDRSYLMVYTSNGGKFDVHLSKLAATEFNAWWFNPRDGHVYDEGDGQSPNNNKPFQRCVVNDGSVVTFRPPDNTSPSDSTPNPPHKNDDISAPVFAQFQDNSIGTDWVLVLDDGNAEYGIPGIPGSAGPARCDGASVSISSNNFE